MGIMKYVIITGCLLLYGNLWGMDIENIRQSLKTIQRNIIVQNNETAAIINDKVDIENLLPLNNKNQSIRRLKGIISLSNNNGFVNQSPFRLSNDLRTMYIDNKSDFSQEEQQILNGLIKTSKLLDANSDVSLLWQAIEASDIKAIAEILKQNLFALLEYHSNQCTPLDQALSNNNEQVLRTIWSSIEINNISQEEDEDEDAENATFNNIHNKLKELGEQTIAAIASEKELENLNRNCSDKSRITKSSTSLYATGQELANRIKTIRALVPSILTKTKEENIRKIIEYVNVHINNNNFKITELYTFANTLNYKSTYASLFIDARIARIVKKITEAEKQLKQASDSALISALTSNKEQYLKNLTENVNTLANVMANSLAKSITSQVEELEDDIERFSKSVDAVIAKCKQRREWDTLLAQFKETKKQEALLLTPVIQDEMVTKKLPIISSSSNSEIPLSAAITIAILKNEQPADISSDIEDPLITLNASIDPFDSSTEASNQPQQNLPKTSPDGNKSSLNPDKLPSNNKSKPSSTEYPKQSHSDDKKSSFHSATKPTVAVVSAITTAYILHHVVNAFKKLPHFLTSKELRTAIIQAIQDQYYTFAYNIAIHNPVARRSLTYDDKMLIEDAIEAAKNIVVSNSMQRSSVNPLKSFRSTTSTLLNPLIKLWRLLDQQKIYSLALYDDLHNAVEYHNTDKLKAFLNEYDITQWQAGHQTSLLKLLDAQRTEAYNQGPAGGEDMFKLAAITRHPQWPASKELNNNTERT